MKITKTRFVSLLVLSLLLTGCGDPPLFELTGNVTLGGEPKKRLIVYFDPINRQIDQFNFGVGETDESGKLTLRSTAGNGLATGNYRVSFTYPVGQDGKSTGSSGDKNEDAMIEITELVPEPYNDRRNSPVEFKIQRTKNEFNFDIPLDK